MVFLSWGFALFAAVTAEAQGEPAQTQPIGPWGGRVTDYTGQPGRFFDPADQKPVKYSDSVFSFDLLVSAPRYSVDVSMHGKKLRQITLPVELAQVNYLRRVQGGRAAVFGLVSSTGWEVCILDPARGLVVDRFLAYVPALSPDGRYIAFVKFFPTHMKYEPDYHYLLYDVVRSATQNRPQGVRMQNPVNVGEPLYPPGVGNDDRDNVLEGPENAHLLESESLFWRSDSSALFFADSYHKKLSLVMVVLEREAKRAYVAQLARDELCKEYRKPDCRVVVASMQLGDKPDGTVRGVLRGLDINLRREFEIRYTQFVPAGS